jgi:hypothetical protein
MSDKGKTHIWKKESHVVEKESSHINKIPNNGTVER